MIDLDQLYVVVVEPSNMQRNIIVNHLRSYGLTNIDEFASAIPAFNSMSSMVPDIVVSSMHLPDMLGTELIQKMREDERLRDITFLLISSETHYRYLEPIRQAGAIAILPKPFSQEELNTALDSTLNYISDIDNESHHEENEDLRVLVVDDSSLSRKYVKTLLSSLSIEQIVEAADGAEALQLIEAGEEFDLIVTDYNMPNIDGKELVEHIRSNSNQPTIPIMMVTSELNENRLAAIQHAGVSAICSKPFSYNTVKSLISKLVNDIDD